MTPEETPAGHVTEINKLVVELCQAICLLIGRRWENALFRARTGFLKWRSYRFAEAVIWSLMKFKKRKRRIEQAKESGRRRDRNVIDRSLESSGSKLRQRNGKSNILFAFTLRIHPKFSFNIPPLLFDQPCFSFSSTSFALHLSYYL